MIKRAALLLFGSLATMGLAQPASAPDILPGVEPGLWEFSRDATGHGARRGCLKEMILLATYAHAGDRCARTILSSTPRQLTLSLECGPGDFGRSQISVTTPRSLKLVSQGFHAGEPYDITVYARRVGECPLSDKR